MADIKTIIESLGYSNSKNLYYPGDALANELMNNHFSKRIIDELNPTAYYCIDDKPFILFFECHGNNISADIVNKVWNAQIPLAICAFENHIRIYNGCSLTEDNDLIPLEEIEEINQINKESPFSHLNISKASFWEKYTNQLAARRLDADMLENIKYATDNLKRSTCAPFAVQLVLRLIFIRYLIDRGVDLDYSGLNGNVARSQEYLLELLKSKEKIYHLFAHLNNKFNGNLFEIYQKNSKSEPDMIDDKSLGILHDLLSGNLVLSSRQRSLFPLYNFNIIPVELISNIYERFLGDEKQDQDKAFYTPPYLVDYLLKQTVIPSLSSGKSCKILDPACGSGIFLVESARKIIENNRRKWTDFDDDALVSSVTDNIWGVDKNPDAIDVAVFSLYLTILDYKEPKSLRDFKLPLLKDHNFFALDFFSDEADKVLGEKKFDFIIGNPPWGSMDGLHVKYCKKRKLPLQNKEISRSFVLRTQDFAQPNTCCCLIVTSKLFYNTKSPAVKFRKWLLEKSKINKYIEFAAVRELIFDKARGPAGVIIYNFHSDQIQNETSEMCHLTLKPNMFFKLFNFIMIEKNDYKFIPQSLLLENDWAWKTLVFGYSHDYRLIRGLMQTHSSVEAIKKSNNLTSGTGIKANDGNQDAKHLHDRYLIDAKNGISPFNVDTSLAIEFKKDKIDRTREKNAQLFFPPYALIKKGFDIRTYRLRAAFTNANIIFPDAVTGISGGNNNEDILYSLVGLFNSSLYAYFNLMLGSSSGIERETGLPSQIFKYPALADSEIACLVEMIQNAIEAEKAFLNNASESDRLRRDLDKLILEKFGLSDDCFIDYALNIQIPLIAENKLIWEKASTRQLIAYSNVFLEYFAKIFSSNEKYVRANLYTNILNHYCAVEFIYQNTEPVTPIAEIKEDNAYMAFVSKLIPQKINDFFYQTHDIINFEENSFFILKTDEYKNWHPAMAKVDLADVLDSIFTGNEAAS